MFFYCSLYLYLVRLYNFLIESLLGVKLVGVKGKYERLYRKAVLDLRVLEQRFGVLIRLDL